MHKGSSCGSYGQENAEVLSFSLVRLSNINRGELHQNALHQGTKMREMPCFAW